MDTTGTLAAFLTGAYVVTRRARSVFNQGVAEPSPSTPTTFTVLGSLQPVSGRDLQRLPEARRTIETRVLFTLTELQVGAQGGAFEADRVAIEGDSWEVQLVEPWRQAPATDPSYYRCVLQAVQTQAGS